MAATTRRNAYTAVLGVVLGLSVGGIVPALASATLTMSQPAANARTSATPTFSGSTADNLDPVHVLVYKGTTATGTPLTLSATPSLGQWSTSVGKAEALTAGPYTALAEQEALLEPLGKPEATAPVQFTAVTEPPQLTIVGPPARSSNRTPGFSGTTNEEGTVVVHVLEGVTQVATASTTASAGSWSIAALTEALPTGRHSYTAYATEASSLGNGEGKSSSVAFEVETEPPTVTINAPPSPSNNTNPSFSGTASENTEVLVHVFEGTTEVASAKTTASAGSWSTNSLSKALPAGKHSFTAYATEKSGLGNADGKSATVGFEVNTDVPQLTLTAPASPSSNTAPTFSGTSSEAGEVEVQISLNGKVVSSATGQVHSGSWTSSAASPALPGGKHTFSAVAVQTSGLGNGQGHSSAVPFEVNTGAPTVTITGPPRSNNRTPTFAGTASENTEVEVHVFLGPTEVASAKTTASGGVWSTAPLSPALATGKHTYTAYATEKSALGNPEGQSATVAFEVNTEPPSLTLVGPELRSGNTNPESSGTTTEDGTVVVHVFSGATEVAKGEAASSAGKWAVAKLNKALVSGKYTMYASQESAIGNGEGRSPSVIFEVETASPTVTITAPPSPSNNTNPSFSGTASENTEVEVHVFQGASEVAKAKTTASGGSWSTGSLSKALPTGNHAFTAYATEKSGVGNPDGKSETVGFEVNTNGPAVTILAPPARSNNTNPSFSGTASENTEVVVHVFEGPTEVASAKTTASAGSWSTGSLSKALPSGKHSFSAYATEKSGIGNAEGESKTVGFEVDTNPPTVTIVSPGRSNNTKPSFSGTASENTEVVVHVFEGATEVGTVATTASGGTWSATLGKALPSGERTFTASATEKSGIGNAEGFSSTVGFEVDTNSPTVTLTGPPAHSNNTTPSFSGSASENTEVTVHVYEGSTEVASARTTASAGSWGATLVKALPSGKHSYTATATEKSALGNPDGTSNTVAFEVNTATPVVTLKGPPTPSNDTTPSFSGTASEETEVVVHVFEGATEVAGVATTASGGNWSATLAKPLASGKHSFTAYATEKSGVGNAEGKSATVGFEVNTEPPAVSINQPPARSSNTSPSFSGTAGENTQVVVHVFEGPTEVDSGSTTAAGGSWSVGALNKALPAGTHSFTAYATEKSSLGNADGKSGTVGFEVNTEPPAVTLNQPASPSSNTKPTFSGSASENTEVVVHVFEGTTEVAKAKALASGGSYTTGTLSKALPTGRHTFTATATEVSGLGNESGTSAPATFEVNTEPPAVTINAIKSPSNQRTPSFSGSASENTEVVVHVLEGSSEVATATTTASAGKWSTSGLSKALPAGTHSFTAYATEKSGLGNADGRSSTIGFEVISQSPTVTLTGPPTPSNNTAPSFSGTASENTEVVVHVYEGTTEVTSAATVASGGLWSAALGKPLPLGKHSYTAVATEKSGVGNEEGVSGTVAFEVNTEPPVVTVTQPKSPSNNTSPAFSGTASENTEVLVRVTEGATELASAKTTASGGTWSTGALTKALPSGKHTFTVTAYEKSGLGNGEGKSAGVGFEVNTEPPVVSINQPPARSSSTNPSFSGTASEDTEVLVHVFEGTTEVASAKTTASAGSWSTSGLSKALPGGTHSFTVYATEKSAIGNAEGKSSTDGFTVDTTQPVVTIVAPASPSNDTTPTFSGAASENTEVVVHVLENGAEVGSVATTASGGSWSATLSKALPQGKRSYTAFATEASGIGNEAGKSGSVGFEVNTEPPAVTILAPKPLSNNTNPSFSGTASENTEVLVHVYEGTTEVASGHTTASKGSWSAALSKALPSGKRSFTVFATEKSGLGNAEGKSATFEFEVNTNPPVVTIKAPPSPTSNTNPSFSGTASENTEVLVRVTEGATELASAKTTASGGTWSTGALTKLLPSGKHTFTVTAYEKSALGNAEGTSAPVTFEVNTEAPVVTLKSPPTPTNNVSPTFSGTASENTEVVVKVLEGTTEVASAKTLASGGSWTTSALSRTLPSGKHTFTATAFEKSGLGNGEGKSATVSFEVNTEAPVVTIVAPKTPSNNVNPAFSGTASENTEVEVHVLEGTTQVAIARTTAAGGKWATTAVSPALPAGKRQFSAYATEKSGLGNAEGKSSSAAFEVNTEPPVVTIQPPAEVSNNTTPSFSGTASESQPVTVEVFSGTKATGKPVATVTATVSGEHWTSPHTSTLENGQYTVVATEPSSLGNAAGRSSEVSFTVNTSAPSVTLTQPVTPSKNTTPSFSGSVSGPAGKTVTVYVHEGGTSQGVIVRSVTAEVSAGKWATAEVAPALPPGKHTFTAVATDTSTIGNGEGKSAPATFVVNTEPPVVTLTPPPSRTNDSTPSFTGTASESTQVVVNLYKGNTASGTPLMSIPTAGTGKEWTTPALTKALEDGQYTVVATQQSGIGNGEGKSAPATFLLDTQPPTVTLNTLPTPSSNRAPAFSGTASESQPVTVEVFKGAQAEGTPVTTVSAEVGGGEWFASPTEKLEFGEYTAIATEPSSIGNKPGVSSRFTFVVAQIAPGVQTESASSVNRTSAALSGAVNPLGAPVSSCNFEVGATTAYGRTIGCALASGASWFPSNAVGFVPVFVRIYGLAPNTLYHYRISSASEGGTGLGADRTFTTLSEPVIEAPPKTTTPPVGKSGVLGSIATLLVPKGKLARIAALLKNKVFKQSFKLGVAGTLTVKWYYLPRGAKLGSAGKVKPLLLASGTVTLKAPGTAVLTLRLTPAARGMLKHAQRLAVTAAATFSAPPAKPESASGKFQLQR